jgi:hypothetical protein
MYAENTIGRSEASEIVAATTYESGLFFIEIDLKKTREKYTNRRLKNVLLLCSSFLLKHKKAIRIFSLYTL